MPRGNVFGTLVNERNLSSNDTRARGPILNCGFCFNFKKSTDNDFGFCVYAHTIFYVFYSKVKDQT